MRIDASNKINELYQAANVKNNSRVAGTGRKDTLEISQTGKDYQIAKQIVDKAPDVREAKILKISRQIEAGTYPVTVRDVADKLVNKYFEER